LCARYRFTRGKSAKLWAVHAKLGGLVANLRVAEGSLALGTLSARSDTGKAIDYSLKRWPSFTHFLDNGRLCMSTNFG
jgi:hypothetical protein